MSAPLPKARRSALVPYIEGERPGDRHDRRRRSAVEHEGELRRKCEAAGLELRVSPDGQHWRVMLARRVVEWWPSSGRVVRDRNYSSPSKAHDHQQVWAIVARHFEVAA